jgi:UDP-2,4-diacetamido-2,4,6-trideoxy-beta-L-altropyranose hydrolase
MKPRVYLRVDGDTEIGLGHITRCTALAQMLKDDYDITFVSRSLSEKRRFRSTENEFEFKLIADEEDFFRFIEPDEIVVLDGYHFDSIYQKKVKSKGVKLVCIDDLHEGEFYADIIINHAPGVVPQDYRGQPHTSFALGPEYALLRPAFLELAKRRRQINGIESVLICFGGSDYKNLTERAVRVVAEVSKFKKIIVVTGPNYKLDRGLGDLLDRDDRIIHLHAIDERKMVAVMLEADLAIVPASGILFEALAIGCIAVSGYYVDNQFLVYQNFKKTNTIIDAEKFEVDSIKTAVDKSLTVVKRGISIDGLSKGRLLKLFNQLALGGQIQCRKAAVSDLPLTFTWAANHNVRRYSFHQHQITMEEHTRWFVDKIRDMNCSYYIVERKSEAIGSIRFDATNKEAVVSYQLSPKWEGRGLGQVLLTEGISQYVRSVRPDDRRIERIVAYVMKSNIASTKAFERLGFIRKEDRGNYRYEKRV